MKSKNVLLMLACTFCFVENISAQSLTADPADDSISSSKRVRWTIQSTIGPGSLVTGVFSSAWGTANNIPTEYETHFSGFAKRYGMGLTDIAASNTMEASLGTLWNEDPRYVPSHEKGLLQRVKYASRMTFFAQRRDAGPAPAYARYIAITASNFMSNSWRVNSESTVSSALTRTALGFAGRFVGNVIRELWAPARGL